MIILLMRFAFWVRKASYTHVEYVILFAFLQQEWPGVDGRIILK